MTCLAVVLMLSVTSVLAAYNCGQVNNWTKFPKSQVAGLTYQPTFKSEDACLKGCEADSSCWNIDWTVTDSTCFFGTAQNPTHVGNDIVVHYDLSRPCPSNCNRKWKKFPKSQVAGLTSQPTFKSEDACLKGCEADSSCWNIDWNVRDIACFFGTAQNPTHVANDIVVHYDLLRYCPGNCNYNWTQFPKSQVAGLTSQPTFKSEAACLKGCEADSSCWNIDWNVRDIACFFGTAQNPTHVGNDIVQHYDLNLKCQSNGVVVPNKCKADVVPQVEVPVVPVTLAAEEELRPDVIRRRP